MTGLIVALSLISAPAKVAPADLSTLWTDACLWEVGSNAEKVPAARQALIREGDRALTFLIPAKLDTKDTLITRALDVVITGIGKGAVPRLVKAIDSDNANIRRNAADLLGSLGSVEAAPAIVKLLADADARLGALAALGKLKASAAVPAIVQVMTSDAPERVRYTAAATLGQIGGDAAVDALVAQLGSNSAPLRFAAQYALEKLKAVVALGSLVDESEHRVRLHAIAALGNIGDAAALPRLLPLLLDSDSLVRGYAAEALGHMLDPGTRALLGRQLTSEQDEFTRGKLREALGRE